METVDSIQLSLLEAELQLEYQDVLKQEEILWYQKSREKWVKLGDGNTTFFHTQRTVRRKRNKIQGLFLENRDWCTDDGLLKEETVNYFQNLFSNDYSTNPSFLHVPLLPSISNACRDALLALVLRLR